MNKNQQIINHSINQFGIIFHHQFGIIVHHDIICNSCSPVRSCCWGRSTQTVLLPVKYSRKLLWGFSSTPLTSYFPNYHFINLDIYLILHSQFCTKMPPCSCTSSCSNGACSSSTCSSCASPRGPCSSSTCFYFSS